MSLGKSLASLFVMTGLCTAWSAEEALASPKGPEKAFIYLKQNWTPDDRAEFYWVSQGSALISYDIYLALEDSLSKQLLNSPQASKLYGLVMAAPNKKANPDRLPIGVTRTDIKDGPYKGVYMGIGCAACHTGEIQSKGKTIIIDGGKTNTFDIVIWMRSLAASLESTLNSPAQFDAMITRMKARGPVDVEDVRRRLKADLDNVQRYNKEGFAVPHSPGPGRMDAINVIQNVFLSMSPQIPDNRRPVDAPVKVPFLWNSSQSAWVEWSGIASNPFSRNFGEALTVFTRLDTSKTSTEPTRYDSTVDTKALIDLEELARKLTPPQWPEALLGKLDRARVARGAALFEKNCSECHNRYPYRWTDVRQQNKRMMANALVPLSVMGVDPQHLNSLSFSPDAWVETKHLAPLFDGKQKVPAMEFFGVLQTKFVDRALDKAQLTPDQKLDATGFLGDDPESKKAPPVRSLKAPPIEGIWSVPPYLHNGSVPNLYQLLSPASERSKVFYVGTEFDPVNVGFDMTGRSGGRLHDTSVIGDSNQGHSFENGTGPGIIGPYLTPAQRYDLIEYIKSLPDQANRVTPYGGPSNPKLANDDPKFFNTKHPY